MAKLSEYEILKPQRLVEGDTIGIISPSSALRPDSTKRGINFLESLGFKIKLGKTVTNVFSRGFISASDQMRADEVMEFFEDKEVKAIFTSTGGYGSTRILDMLDYEVIKNNPKILMGFSDTTGLQLAIWKKCRLITFSGPTPEMTQSNYDNDKWSLANAIKILSEGTDSFQLPMPKTMLPRTLGNHDGAVTARLLGGNLTMICGLLGTDYDPPLKDAILFMEEVNESAYKIEMLLQHLKLAYKLDYLAGAIIGDFSNIESSGKSNRPSDSDPSIDEILLQKFSPYRYPIAYGYNFSHGKFCMTIPQGAKAALTTPLVEIVEGVVV